MVATVEVAPAPFPAKQAQMTPAPAAAAPAHDPVQLGRMMKSVKALIQGLGEDITREGLIDTPKRVAKAMLDVSRGYRQTGKSVIGDALFHEPIVNEGGNGVVLVRDIDYASTSEETLLPFYGRAHIAYIPVNGVVLGLSKLARVTRLYGKRLQTQERLAREVADAMHKYVGAKSVAVVLEARHLVPGPEPQNVVVATLTGDFVEQPHMWQELLAMLGMDEPSQENITRLTSGLSAEELPPQQTVPHDNNSEDTSSAASTSSGSQSEADEPPTTEAQVSDPMEAAVMQIMTEMGEDPSRPALQGTPGRYINCMMMSTSGYNKALPRRVHSSIPWTGNSSAAGNAPNSASSTGSSVDDVISSSPEAASSPNPSNATGPLAQQQPKSMTVTESDGVVRVHSGLHFYSQCEHHMLPFYGTLSVAYTPGANFAPLSQEELDYIVSMYTHRLQVQERITHQVADAVAEIAGAKGVLVVARAAHMCMLARGVENHSGSTMTMAVRGTFESDRQLRLKYLPLLQQQ